MNGNVIPFRGNRPIIAPMLMTACTLSQASTPTTSNRLNVSGARTAMFLMREKNASMIPSNAVTPIKPNFSAYMAKMESLAASGR